MTANPIRESIQTAYAPDTGFAELLGRSFTPRGDVVSAPLSDLTALLAREFVPMVEEPAALVVQVETIAPPPPPVALVEVKQTAPARGRVALRRKTPADGGATQGAHDKVDALLAETMAGIADYCCVCGRKRGYCNIGPFWGGTKR